MAWPVRRRRAGHTWATCPQSPPLYQSASQKDFGLGWSTRCQGKKLQNDVRIRRWKHVGKVGWLLSCFQKMPMVLFPRQVRWEYKSNETSAGLWPLHSKQEGCPRGCSGPPGRQRRNALCPQVESSGSLLPAETPKGQGDSTRLRRHSAGEHEMEMFSFLLKSEEINELLG